MTTNAIADLRVILAAFWRRGRQSFVPLTADEADRATGGMFSPEAQRLHRRGIVRASFCGRAQTYDLTDEGKRIAERIGATRALEAPHSANSRFSDAP